MISHADVLVIGGGVVGLTIALEIKQRNPARTVIVVEKEPMCGAHASGRNSGVIHAGFYYSPDSLKARFCREGNLAMHAFCRARGLPLNTCGKLVVAADESQVAGLEELYRRGRANDVPLELISAEEARRKEPRVKTCRLALWSPTTSSADPVAVMVQLARDAVAKGIDLRTGVAYRSGGRGWVETTAGRLTTGFIINAAGLYADRIARDFGFSQQCTILPFKGLYLYSDEPAGRMRTHVYPVPDLRFPFLGVHYTVTVDGHIKIGPTAMPAFWRENYHGLDRFKAGELAEILVREASLMVHAGFDFRGLAVEEMRKCSRRYLVAQAARLIEGVHPSAYRRWGRTGIRAQLLDLATRRLVMDFRTEGDGDSLHVLNAVSPAWTCSFPFAKHIVDGLGGSPA